MEQEKYITANRIQSGILMFGGKKKALREAWETARNKAQGSYTGKEIAAFVQELVYAKDYNAKLAMDDIVNYICMYYDESIAKLQKQFDEL